MECTIHRSEEATIESLAEQPGHIDVARRIVPTTMTSSATQRYSPLR
jgi:hypothetical protein